MSLSLHTRHTWVMSLLMTYMSHVSSNDIHESCLSLCTHDIHESCLPCVHTHVTHAHMTLYDTHIYDTHIYDTHIWTTHIWLYIYTPTHIWLYIYTPTWFFAHPCDSCYESCLLYAMSHVSYMSWVMSPICQESYFLYAMSHVSYMSWVMSPICHESCLLSCLLYIHVIFCTPIRILKSFWHRLEKIVTHTLSFNGTSYIRDMTHDMTLM
jgi:hypothetical protein